jgi:hypothetical protein
MPAHPPANPRAIRPAAAILLALAALMSGCGSSDNGVASKEPKEILAASKSAVAKASSVTISSKSAQGSVTFNLELRLTRNGGQGKVTLLALTFEVIRIGETLYLKGGPVFYKRLGITQSVPAGSWLQAPARRLPQLAAFTNLSGEATRIVSTSGRVTKGQKTTIEGQPVIELKTEGKLYKGRLFIKTTGEPYPVKLERTGRETGHTTFTGWDNTPPPTAPTNTTTLRG